MSNYNSIAPFYDSLAKLIFGNNLYNAKMEFVKLIKPGSNILIVGGGTGDILNNLLAVTQNTLIDFIEPSERMIKIAEGKLQKQYAKRVNFINHDHRYIQSNKHYDVAMAFFLLDVFKLDEALVVSNKISDSLKPGGTLLFADFFYTANYFQRTLVWIMYRFFKITTRVSAGKLPDYDSLFYQNKLTLTDEKHFIKSLVRSRVYKKIF